MMEKKKFGTFDVGLIDIDEAKNKDLAELWKQAESLKWKE
jgi:hypothetical protein